jgi:hypothetical protein
MKAGICKICFKESKSVWSLFDGYWFCRRASISFHEDEQIDEFSDWGRYLKKCCPYYLEQKINERAKRCGIGPERGPQARPGGNREDRE